MQEHECRGEIYFQEQIHWKCGDSVTFRHCWVGGDGSSAYKDQEWDKDIVSVCVCICVYLYLLHIEYQSEGIFLCVIFLHMQSKQTCWVKAISRKHLWPLRHAVANTSSCACSQHPTASKKKTSSYHKPAASPSPKNISISSKASYLYLPSPGSHTESSAVFTPAERRDRFLSWQWIWFQRSHHSVCFCVPNVHRGAQC